MFRVLKFALCLALILLVSTCCFAQSNANPNGATSANNYGPMVYGSFTQSTPTSMTFGMVNVSLFGPDKVYLQVNYSYQDWALGIMRNEFFYGPVPANCLSWSGTPEFNGDLRVTLTVDTTNIEPSADMVKVGPGGPIQFTWVQKPNSKVTTQIGPQTIEDSQYIVKYTGKSYQVDNPTVNGTFYGAAFDSSNSVNIVGTLYFYDQRVLGFIKK